MLCIICNKNFKNVSSLKTHYLSKKHKLALLNTTNNNLSNNNGIQTSNVNNTNDMIQNTRAGNNNTISNTHIQTISVQLDANILPVAENKQILEIENVKYECQGCDKLFAYKTNLYRHRNKCYFYKEAYKISCKTQLDVKIAAKLLKQRNISKIFNIGRINYII